MASATDDEPQALVPITLSIDRDGHKLRDQFLWNANDKVVRVSRVAAYLIFYTLS